MKKFGETCSYKNFSAWRAQSIRKEEILAKTFCVLWNFAWGLGRRQHDNKYYSSQEFFVPV